MFPSAEHSFPSPCETSASVGPLGRGISLETRGPPRAASDFVSRVLATAPLSTRPSHPTQRGAARPSYPGDASQDERKLNIHTWLLSVVGILGAQTRCWTGAGCSIRSRPRVPSSLEVRCAPYSARTRYGWSCRGGGVRWGRALQRERRREARPAAVPDARRWRNYEDVPGGDGRARLLDGCAAWAAPQVRVYQGPVNADFSARDEAVVVPQTYRPRKERRFTVRSIAPTAPAHGRRPTVNDLCSGKRNQGQDFTDVISR